MMIQDNREPKDWGKAFSLVWDSGATQPMTLQECANMAAALLKAHPKERPVWFDVYFRNLEVVDYSHESRTWVRIDIDDIAHDAIPAAEYLCKALNRAEAERPSFHIDGLNVKGTERFTLPDDHDQTECVVGFKPGQDVNIATSFQHDYWQAGQWFRENQIPVQFMGFIMQGGKASTTALCRDQWNRYSTVNIGFLAGQPKVDAPLSSDKTLSGV